MFVYTFWEPRENLPVYLQLCMETWKKFLPNATIVLLDCKNIGEFIDVRDFGSNLFSSGRFTLTQIADAIRIALLAKHGGVWLDADTIILNSEVEKYFLPDEKHRVVFFGVLQDRSCHIAFINAPPVSMCMKLWYECNREKIYNLNSSTPYKWDIFGNSFINEYSKKYVDEINILDRRTVMPELSLCTSLDSRSRTNAYINYYFLQNLHLTDVQSKMLLLHNSWSPDFFKQISFQDFFSFDCTMVNVLAEALDIKLPPSSEPFQIRYRKSRLKILSAAR